jgi:lipid II:glycine glycyltransferase (peptidoglycan interpeptide bridge formation enzyme)
MLKQIDVKDISELYETPIVQQTAFWSAVKNKLGVSTLAIDYKANSTDLFEKETDNRIIASDVLIIIQQINRDYCIAYVPYGPELEPDEEMQGRFLEELSESIRPFLPDNCIMIRYDLCWKSYWTDEDNFDSSGNWLGEPGVKSQEMLFNFNTIGWNFRKASFNILPSNTVFLNLNDGAENLLKQMKSKTRYNIGLSRRKGVQIRTAGMESIPVWYRLYQETARRNGIVVNDIKYFEAILSAASENTGSQADVKLLIAEWENKPLAAMFLIISDKRGSYLYGASSDLNRNLMATYALQWEAINISIRRGCTEYDMFGVSPNSDPSHPLYGLYKFKLGFGGHIFHSLGCWDYPLIENRYFAFRSFELTTQGFHTN